MFCVFRHDNIAYDNWALIGIRSMYYFLSCLSTHTLIPDIPPYQDGAYLRPGSWIEFG
jgi:hypothetical protein